MSDTVAFIDSPSPLASLSEWEAFIARIEQHADIPVYADELAHARRMIDLIKAEMAKEAELRPTG